MEDKLLYEAIKLLINKCDTLSDLECPNNGTTCNECMKRYLERKVKEK